MVLERGASFASLGKKEWVTNRERRNRKMEVRKMREKREVRKKGGRKRCKDALKGKNKSNH